MSESQSPPIGKDFTKEALLNVLRPISETKTLSLVPTRPITEEKILQ